MTPAFLYDNDAHVEKNQRLGPEVKGARGLVGRQVASSEFIDAYIRHGRWDRIVGLVRTESSRASLVERFRAQVRDPAQSLRIVPVAAFHDRFLAGPTAEVVHLPHPLEPEYAWARQHAAPHGFALSGVTHTICSRAIMDTFTSLVTAPFEPYDTLFCISRASVEVVRRVTSNYAAWLKERHGGNPRLRARLEHVPLGVDTEKFRPATPEERASARKELGIDPNALVVLYVGRFTHFAKVHPFPMFRGVAEAARATGRKVHIVLAGWAEEDKVTQLFEEGARIFAAGIPTTFVNGMDPKWRFRVWRCGDVFTSLTDNIQETLSQTILEAQACGMPVVVTDWDGCRDEVADGETGFRVPTRMVEGATWSGTSRYLFGESTYAELLADTNQTVSVDVPAAAAAFRRLFEDAALRESMGGAARQRVLELFTWRHVVARYEEVWREQEAVRLEYARAERTEVHTPPPYPDVEFSFASYRSEVLPPDRRVVCGPDAEGELEVMLGFALTSYRKNRRVADLPTLHRALRRAEGGCTISEACEALGPDPERARATVAWMLKYDLLRVTTPHASLLR